MKHDISELYSIEGMKGVYSADYLDKYFVQEIPTNNPRREGYAQRLTYKESQGGKLNVHTASGIKVVYPFGCYVFFDTHEELIEARAERQNKLTEQARRRAALSKLEKLSTANLEKLVAKLKL